MPRALRYGAFSALLGTLLLVPAGLASGLAYLSGERADPELVIGVVLAYLAGMALSGTLFGIIAPGGGGKLKMGLVGIVAGQPVVAAVVWIYGVVEGPVEPLAAMWVFLSLTLGPIVGTAVFANEDLHDLVD